MSDVNNPLLCENGCTKVYGRQKGANENELLYLERGMTNYIDVLEKHTNKIFRNVKGSGAAGGLGVGIMASSNANIISGFDFVCEFTELEKSIKNSDFVITGEGSIDSQSLNGKVPVGVGRIAKKYNIPTFAMAGKIGNDIEKIYDNGITSILCIQNSAETLQNALINGEKNITKTSEHLARIILALSLK